MFARVVDAEISLGLLQMHHAEMVFATVDQHRDELRVWLPWVDETPTVAEVDAYIQRSLLNFAQHGNPTCGIWFQDGFVGYIGLHGIDRSDRTTSIGYWLAASHQGKGIMTRACRSMIDHVFQDLRLNRIVIEAAVQNFKSRAIPERLGFTQEGVQRQARRLNAGFTDMVLYGLLAEDWAKTRT